MSFNEYLKNFWGTASGKGNNPVVENRIWRKLHRQILFRNYAWKIGTVTVAASVAVGLFVRYGSTLAEMEENTTTLLSYSPQTNTEVVLPDGSKVWLDAGSTLTCPSEMTTRREIFLKGNAAFDVVKTEDLRNFIINLDSSYIEVKGTSFTVRNTDAEEISVILYSGAIDFVSTSNGQTVAMKPSNKLIFNREDQSILVTPSFRGISWDHGVYLVRNASLNSVAEFIEWRYGVQVEVSPSVGNSQMMNGQILHGDTCEVVVEKMCFMLNLECTGENGHYCITR